LSLNARSYLFDAGVLSLFYEGERSVKPYFDRVFSARVNGYISEVNLAEFYYKAALKKGVETVDVWYRQIRQSPFTIVSPDEAITKRAALWKLRRSDLSLADCFALATTEEVAQVLLTTDSVLAKIKGVKSVHIPL
jgi:predicted nucleic acid-binding protein